MSFYQERIEGRKIAEENSNYAWVDFTDKATAMSDELIDTLLRGQLGLVRSVLPFNDETQKARDHLLTALNPQDSTYHEARVSWLQGLVSTLDTLCADPIVKGTVGILYSQRASAVGKALRFMGAPTYPTLTR